MRSPLKNTDLQVIKVDNRSELGNFIRLPWQIYKGNPFWVAPLIGEEMKFYNPHENPFFDHSQVTLFLVKRGHYLKGRIAAIIDQNYIDFHHEKVGFFGCFECVNDNGVANLLFDSVAKVLREGGMEIMRGPMNFSTNETCGLLVENFEDSPLVMMTYNLPYYSGLVEGYGFTKAKDLYAYYLSHPDKKIPERLERVALKLQNRNSFSVRKIRLSDFEKEVKRIRLIYNSAWEANWGFVPMTEAEFDHLAKNLKLIVDPDLVFIAEVDNQPVGFSLTLPDINYALKRLNGKLFPFGIIKLLWFRRKISRVRVITMGVKREYRKRGIDLAFYYHTFREGYAKGYTEGEFSWVLEDNYMMRKGLEDLGAEIYKTYRIYDHQL
ncbi:N-acetyltransferase [bacterium]|nr:N-acetyltransferase [bacterium]